MKKNNNMKDVLSSFDSDLSQDFLKTNNDSLNENSKVLKKDNDFNLKTYEVSKTKTSDIVTSSLDIVNFDNNDNDSRTIDDYEILLTESKDFSFKPTDIIQLTENLSNVENVQNKPVIKVIGIGGAGNNIVEFIANKLSISNNVIFYQLNTDSQHLKYLKSKSNRFLIESKITKGMGSGGNPESGRLAMKDFEKNIYQILEGTDICIIIAGFGKGTGTGGAPVVSKIAKTMGILTLAFITMPSSGEGKHALEKAVNGLKELKESADAITTISNEKVLYQNVKNNLSLFDVYSRSNYEIGQSVKVISDIVLLPYHQNIDLADVKNFFRNKNNVNLFASMKIRFNNNEIKDVDKILKQTCNQLIFEQNLNNASSALVLFYVNSKTPSTLYSNTVTTLKQISGNKDLDLVYGINITEDELIGFDVIVVNNEPTILSGNNITSILKINNSNIFPNNLTSSLNVKDNNDVMSRKMRQKMLISNNHNELIMNAVHNQLEDDFNDLIETKKLTTDQMNKIINKTFESYFDKKSDNLTNKDAEYNESNIFKS
ncbi:FtsZ/tubulin family protein [Mycoplasmoides alvi]|uniref:hypothetical protein n=1 Tax=Mycoplasmoides alvi TaxID=78580 RepID=UPI0006964E83|nr:hypothetical protein [Mycoplasmoides alvi]